MSAALQKATNFLVYNSKIALSFTNKVFSSAKLTGIPDINAATQGYSSFVNGITSGAWRKVTIGQAGELVGAGVTIGGFFLAGEMLGRWSIIGYKIEGTEHSGHH
ncbi:hypothetical protein HDV06_002347 [Boothiomyces sp. JEL0866]|nr:hypothetical protein HDV06_002347 [Boothiomyces sp. JEL0866]